MTSRYVLDPTGERSVAERELLARPETIVQRYRKPTFAKPAPVDLRHEIATQCDVVIEALAD